MNISDGDAIGKVFVGRVAACLLIIFIFFEKAQAMSFIEVVEVNDRIVSMTVKYVVRDFPIDDPTPAPAQCVSSGCRVGVAYWFDNSSTGMTNGGSGTVSIPKGTKTVGDIARIYSQRYPLGTVHEVVIYHLGAFQQPCIGMASSPSNGDYTLLPGNLCNYLDLRNVHTNACYIDGMIELQHGIVANDMLNNHSVSAAVNLRCLQPATVKITMPTSEPYLWLNNSRTLRASIFVDGSSILGGVNIQIPGERVNKTVNFSSKLIKTAEIEAGNYRASSVIVLEIL
ncbi:TPA: hypothetical protein SMF43_001767 [Serratia marcescens]|nr:hypothetical protein [Serratia marcescens]